MPNPIRNLNKLFDSRIRLGIMALLMVEGTADFNLLREKLELTDGNLASHISALEEAGYLIVKKQFLGKKPNTSYSATPGGREAFSNHLSALEELIKNSP